MREKIRTFCICIFIFVTLPSLTVAFLQNETEDLSQEVENEQSVKRSKEQDMQQVEEEQRIYQLVGILANQITITAPEEAIRAQAVIARTEYLKAIEDKEEIPGAKSIEELHEIWREQDYNKNYAYLKKCVLGTRGEVLRCEDHLMDAAYHALSNGATRQMEGQAGVTSVPCPEDLNSQDYLSVSYWERSEIEEKVLQAGRQAQGDQIQVTLRDPQDYVQKVKMFDQEFTGEEVRDMLHIPSSCFYMDERKGKIRIVSKGIGHGIGLSQYTAEQMAREGKDHRKILNYFFPEAEICQQNGID